MKKLLTLSQSYQNQIERRIGWAADEDSGSRLEKVCSEVFTKK